MSCAKKYDKEERSESLNCWHADLPDTELQIACHNFKVDQWVPNYEVIFIDEQENLGPKGTPFTWPKLSPITF